MIQNVIFRLFSDLVSGNHPAWLLGVYLWATHATSLATPGVAAQLERAYQRPRGAIYTPHGSQFWAHTWTTKRVFFMLLLILVANPFIFFGLCCFDPHPWTTSLGGDESSCDGSNLDSPSRFPCAISIWNDAPQCCTWLATIKRVQPCSTTNQLTFPEIRQKSPQESDDLAWQISKFAVLGICAVCYAFGLTQEGFLWLFWFLSRSWWSWISYSWITMIIDIRNLKHHWSDNPFSDDLLLTTSKSSDLTRHQKVIGCVSPSPVHQALFIVEPPFYSTRQPPVQRSNLELISFLCAGLPTDFLITPSRNETWQWNIPLWMEVLMGK